ncbi:MAG: sulfotransferase [Actinomycetota bacterium]|nr:sulfotransferase [Actinomycetota bacterium]
MRSGNGSNPQPLIIVGTGRCGSTMLHRLLARHEHVGWLSTWNETFPAQTWLSAGSHLYRAPAPARLKDWRGFPKPYEAYEFWEHYLPGFSRRDRPPTAADVPADGIERVRRATADVLRRQRRRRLLVKVTGWARVGYFDRIYPDARFISLRRDPRAVVSSWIKAGWLDTTSPPDSDEWQWGEVDPALLELWEELGGGPVLSGVLKIHLDLADIASNLATVPGRWREVWYEDVITKPEPTVRELCAFADLEWTPRFEAEVRSMGFYDPSGKWRSHLTEAEGERVLEFLRRADALSNADANPDSAASR